MDKLTTTLRKVAPAAAVALAMVAFADAAHAQTVDNLTEFIDEWIDWIITAFALFVLLVGLVVAWFVAWRNVLAGVAIAAAVILFAAAVGNYEGIGSAVGLG